MSTEHLVLNESLQSYLASMHSGHEDALLKELRLETQKLCGERAVMQISGAQGTLLSLLVGVIRAWNVVEVGTFTGYSALCLARALPADGSLLCCDVSEEWTAVGRRYWQRAGVGHKIDLRIAPASETLRALPPETRFDLAFIDADKPGYDAYYEALLPLMRQDALFVFDNMLYHGAIEDRANDEAMALNALNRKLRTDPRVESVLLPFADGLNFARVR